MSDDLEIAQPKGVNGDTDPLTGLDAYTLVLDVEDNTPQGASTSISADRVLINNDSNDFIRAQIGSYGGGSATVLIPPHRSFGDGIGFTKSIQKVSVVAVARPTTSGSDTLHTVLDEAEPDLRYGNLQSGGAPQVGGLVQVVFSEASFS